MHGHANAMRRHHAVQHNTHTTHTYVTRSIAMRCVWQIHFNHRHIVVCISIENTVALSSHTRAAASFANKQLVKHFMHQYVIEIHV